MMVKGWQIFWRKHHVALLVFVGVTVLYTAIGIARMYGMASSSHVGLAQYQQRSANSEFSSHRTLLHTLGIVGLIWIIGRKFQINLTQGGLSDRLRWRFNLQWTAALALWGTLLNVINSIATFDTYTSIYAIAGPLPLKLTVLFLWCFGWYWSFGLVVVRLVQWSPSAQQGLLYVFLAGLMGEMLLIRFGSTDYRSFANPLNWQYLIPQWLALHPLYEVLVVGIVTALILWWTLARPIAVSDTATQ